MEFCTKCGKPMKIGTETAICSCGFVKQVNPTHFNETIKKPVKKGEGVLKESDENKCAKGFPHKCGKCGCEFADVSDLGVFYSDESSVYLFKCKKCGKVERDAYGLSNA